MAAVHAVARRHGDHRARDRGAPAAPGRRSPADGVRAAGTEIAALGERIRSTARKLWLLYVALTLIETAMLASLWVAGVDDLMTPYEALAYAFSTMPTGGFSTQADSIAAFSAASQWILALFMAIAGANFALMYRAFVRRRPLALVRDEEFRLYRRARARVRRARRDAVGLRDRGGRGGGPDGHVPGGLDHDHDRVGHRELRPLAAPTPAPLFALMFVGGSAGSTAGSIKIVRHLLLGKVLRREIDQTLSPEVVLPIRLNGVPIDERTMRAVASFVLLYVGIWAVGASVIAIDSRSGSRRRCARRARGLSNDSRQHRAGIRHRRSNWLIFFFFFGGGFFFFFLRSSLVLLVLVVGVIKVQRLVPVQDPAKPLSNSRYSRKSGYPWAVYRRKAIPRVTRTNRVSPGEAPSRGLPSNSGSLVVICLDDTPVSCRFRSASAFFKAQETLGGFSCYVVKCSFVQVQIGLKEGLSAVHS